MPIRALIMKIVQQDRLNFLLTNRLPRRLATTWMGRFSRIENPLICALSIRVWRLFTDLDLSDAQERQFRSLHACFTRRLKDGARPIEPDPTTLVSPCDAIVGASGTIDGSTVLQVKGMPYTLEDLFGGTNGTEAYRDGRYVTLRLTSAMYHRFHAPHDLRVGSVTHIFGDTWNVNPPTLKRIARLFCKNERALIQTTLGATNHHVALVAVAAILVAGIRLSFLDLEPKNRTQPRRNFTCDVPLAKGAEMGWFEHGSTILVFVPNGFSLCPDIEEGGMIRTGQPLMNLPIVTYLTSTIPAAEG